MFEEARNRDLNKVYTPIYESIEQETVKAFFTVNINELFDDNEHKLVESQDFNLDPSVSS